jgi:antirestriction protein ArdC
MDLLQQGTVPWKKPWNTQSNMPRNIVSKKEYKGVNVFLLACQEYSSAYWMTYKQCQERGGYVKQGQKSTPVIFWKWIDGKKDDPDAGSGKIPLLRYYSVFNLEQTEGISSPVEEQVHNDFDPIGAAEQVIANMPLKPDIQHMGNRALYRPSTDTVTLPPQHTFSSPEEYYSTAFHELTHSTGHQIRLARKSILDPSFFGSHEYSKEELVAEMGAAFLCGHCGIENNTIENSAAYLQGWLKALKNDKTLLVHAAAQAQKASDYIMGHMLGEEGD